MPNVGTERQREISAFTGGACFISIVLQNNCGRKVNENYSWDTLLEGHLFKGSLKSVKQPQVLNP